jgi:cbb3-type cytochrome oxidase maturation protein
MNILLVMIPLSILLLVGAGIAFFWAVDHDQFDDMDTPRLLPLLDDAPAPPPSAGAAGEAATPARPVPPA